MLATNRERSTAKDMVDTNKLGLMIREYATRALLLGGALDYEAEEAAMDIVNDALYEIGLEAVVHGLDGQTEEEIMEKLSGWLDVRIEDELDEIFGEYEE
jgi:hypothetical protein